MAEPLLFISTATTAANPAPPIARLDATVERAAT
jgi:hypothetical protein